jgi:hypothetical protein
MRESSRLDLCNCFAARQAARHITRLYEKHLAEADVTSAQFSILVVLDEKRRASMSEMADALVMDRTTLLRAGQTRRWRWRSPASELLAHCSWPQ